MPNCPRSTHREARSSVDFTTVLGVGAVHTARRPGVSPPSIRTSSAASPNCLASPLASPTLSSALMLLPAQPLSALFLAVRPRFRFIGTAAPSEPAMEAPHADAPPPCVIGEQRPAPAMVASRACPYS